jgi:exonuclease III
MRIILSNIRGLNCREKRSQIRNALRMWNGEVIYFQETKMERMGRAVVRSQWNNPFAN